MDFKLQIHSNLFGVKCTSKVKGFKMIPQHDRRWCITVRTVPAHYDALLYIKLHICVNGIQPRGMTLVNRLTRK